MSALDDYLLALPFVDGHPSQPQTTFMEIHCACGAVYATRVSRFETESWFADPASDWDLLESDAKCPHCGGLMHEQARTATMHVSGGFAIRSMNPPLIVGVDPGAPGGDKSIIVKVGDGKVEIVK